MIGKTFLVAAALALLSGCAGMMQGAAQRANTPRTELLEPDAIRIVLCGTNAPLPNPERAEACTAVFAGGEMLLFDAGAGSFRRMQELRLPVTEIRNVFLTHLHDDHTADVSHTVHRSWMMGRTTLVHLHGPKGVSRLAQAHDLSSQIDREYRVAHHGLEVLDPKWDVLTAYEIQAYPGLIPVYHNGDLTVSAFLVDHAPIDPAFGYRIDYRGKVVVVSGDTKATPSLEEHAKNADVLVAEVMNKEFVERAEARMTEQGQTRNAKILRDIRDYHIGTDELAALAERAGVSTLILTHLVPGVSNSGFVNWLIFDRPVSAGFSGAVIVGEDGTLFELPVED